MTQTPSVNAWNNFVMRSDPAAYGLKPRLRAAAIANLFMALANNGGINSFLTSTSEIDATEVERSLYEVGAKLAAEQFGAVLQGLGRPLPAASHDTRWAALEESWKEALDSLDTLSLAADEQLTQVLNRHVASYEDYYAGLT